MSIQLSKISASEQGSFKLVELSGSQKPLPALNSVVGINILEKLNSGYKVLIDGRLFSCNLPVQPEINETLAAKVINHEPFILSLDNIATLKGLDEAVSYLLIKLQLSPAKDTERVLRSFLVNKKPVLKSKIEKIVSAIESNNLHLSDDQLNEIAEILGSDETGSQVITSSVLNLFNKSNTELAADIMNKLRELTTLASNDETVKNLHKMLVMNAEEESIDPILLRDYFTNSKDQLEFIINSGSELKGRAAEILAEIKNTLLIYNLRKGLKAGSSHSFVIIKSGTDYELLEFNMESINRVFNFNLKMSPENLGLINAKGTLSNTRLSLELCAEKETSNFLQQNRHELEERFDQNLHCAYNLMFSNSDISLNNIPSRKGNINVKL